MDSEISGHVEAGNSGTTIEIKIKTMDSQTYTLQVDKQMPVPALKERIASVTGVVTEHQRLICRGKVLKDDQLLSAYHVEDGHTLHLVVREPAASSSEGLPADSAFDHSSTGNRGQLFQVAPGIVVETFNMPGQGDRGLSDVSRILSAVLGSMGITNPGSNNEDQDGAGHEEVPTPGSAAETTHISPEQSGMRSSNDRSGLQNVFGIPAGLSFGSAQAPVIPDALATLSQYLSHMRQEFLNSGNVGESNERASSIGESDGTSGLSSQSENALPTPASLAELLSATRQMLNQITEECLLQFGRQLENQESLTDSVARTNAQSGALRTGTLLQNLGAYFLELGRTVTTLRLGRSPSEAVVNAGPAVYISPSGPNPLMVQPLPFQPGASFGTPISGTLQSGSGLTNSLGAGPVHRRIDIQIQRVAPSTHQTEPAGSRQSSAQRQSIPTIIGVSRNTQPAAGTSDSPSSNSGAGVNVLPFRSMMTAIPDLNRSPSEAGSLAFLYPLLGRYQSVASGNLRGGTERQAPGDTPAAESTAVQPNVGDPAGSGRAPVSTRTIDINILSAGGISSDQNAEGQLPPAILQILRRLFPGGEFLVESVTSEGAATTATEQAPPSGTTASAATEQAPPNVSVTQEAESRVTEEGLFFSRMLRQMMPLISPDHDTDHAAQPGEGETSQQRDGATSSAPAEDSEARTSRRRGDHNPEPPNAKRQKME